MVTSEQRIKMLEEALKKVESTSEYWYNEYIALKEGIIKILKKNGSS